MKILKTTLFIFSLLYSLIVNAQLSINEENFNSEGCLTSVKLDYTVPSGLSSSTRYYIYVGFNGNIERIYLGKKSSGTYTTPLINITSTDMIALRSKRFSFIPNSLAKRHDSFVIIRCPNDLDEDGVLNINDDCPDTPGTTANNGCPPDSDNDGIIDSIDDCPNDYGTSGNGCPDTDGDGLNDFDDDCPNRYGGDNGCPLPDFSVESFSLTQENVGGFNNPQFELNFCATIQNTGDDDGRPRRVEIILTTKNSIYDPGRVQTVATISNYANINSNGGTSEYCSTHLDTFIDPFFGSYRLSQYNYVLVMIDEGSSEYSTENNYAFFSKRITNISGKNSLVKSKIIDESLYVPVVDLKIFDFSGRLIKSTKITTQEDEDSVISSLSSGIYILKTPTETRKIVK